MWPQPLSLPAMSFADEREAVQKKTFTKWVNSHLGRVTCRIGDLYTDLRDGRMLIRLLEVLSGEQLVSNAQKNPFCPNHDPGPQHDPRPAPQFRRKEQSWAWFLHFFPVWFTSPPASTCFFSLFKYPIVFPAPCVLWSLLHDNLKIGSFSSASNSQGPPKAGCVFTA